MLHDYKNRGKLECITQLSYLFVGTAVLIDDLLSSGVLSAASVQPITAEAVDQRLTPQNK
ncbi:hypothetical protein C4D60_Mb05t29420 [Musa balbisiana]|uniref:Uncharacterized protein n=1 Tax=Musa balbisiana TaxID=52838 RepID=A0A4S8JZP8_MUSBA|nr:hypothetical protein C4D60_Mb05t29420 [Musa balbisiana]